MADNQESVVELDDGCATTLQRWGTAGPIVLCTHGMTSSRRSWERLAAHLDGRFRIYAYDQRGHGDSAAVEGPMTLQRGVADLANVLGSLGEPVDTLLGHSWGGAVAILGGERFPVRRVAALDPMIRQVSDTWYEEYLAELHESFAIHGAPRDEATRRDYADWSPVDVEAKVHAVRTMTAAPIDGLRRENPPQSWDLRDAIARYGKPLWLGMASRGEGINDDATLDEIERRRSQLVKIVAFPGGGHNLHRTSFDVVSEALDAWLSST